MAKAGREVRVVKPVTASVRMGMLEECQPVGRVGGEVGVEVVEAEDWLGGDGGSGVGSNGGEQWVGDGGAAAVGAEVCGVDGEGGVLGCGGELVW